MRRFDNLTAFMCRFSRNPRSLSRDSFTVYSSHVALVIFTNLMSKIFYCYNWESGTYNWKEQVLKCQEENFSQINNIYVYTK